MWDLLIQTYAHIVMKVWRRMFSISGGVAQLTDIDDFLSFHLRLPVFISDQPHLSPLKGAGELLNTPDLLDWLGEERG